MNWAWQQALTPTLKLVLMALADAALYRHCLPADIGDEVEASVMDRFRVAVAEEANKKVYVIMAVLAAAKVEDLSGRLAALET